MLQLFHAGVQAASTGNYSEAGRLETAESNGEQK
jgi:hypothetical protein